MKIASEEDIQDFADDLRRLLGSSLERIILYGSYARNDHTTGSDIDLALIVNEDVNETEIFDP